MFRQIKNIIAALVDTLISIKSGAMKYILISGLIALVIFGIMVWLTWTLAGKASTYLSDITPWGWAHESALFGFIIALSVIVGFVLIMKYVLLIAMSPLLSHISEKAEKSIQKDYQIRGFSAAASAARSVRINMRNLVKEVVLTVILLILGFIPGLNIISIPLLLVVQAYFTGFGIMDFYLERHMTFKETLVEVYKHKYAATILGGIFMLLFAIPILGAIVAPYLTTVAGTRYFLNIYPSVSLENNSQLINKKK